MAWGVNPMAGPTEVGPLPEGETRTMARQASFDGSLVDPDKQGLTLELAGKESLGEGEAYKILITSREGDVQTVYLDADTYLEKKRLAKSFAGGQETEQLLGRTHRPGQEDDLCTTDYYDHTDSLDQAMSDVIADALYIEDSTGQRQKILYADGERIKHKKQMILDAQNLELEQQEKEREQKNGN